MADKIAYHPDGKHIINFCEKNHTYIDNFGKSYTSVTSFIKPFFPGFDSVAMSKKCSAGKNPKYAGRSPEDILEEWAAEGNRGSSEGNNTHEYAEWLVNGWDDSIKPGPISERCEMIFKQVDKIVDYLFTNYDFIGSEIIIFSPDMGIAGMVDLLFFDPETQTILILDWKNNKVITVTNIHQNAFYPIEHLQDTHKSKYALQLSLYQHIINKERYYPQAKKYRRSLLHVIPEISKAIPVEYFDYEIKEILKKGKKTNDKRIR